MRIRHYHGDTPPVGGDDARYGDFSDDSRGLAYYEMPDTWWGDYIGDLVTRSNFVALTRDFPDTFVTVTDVVGHTGLYLPELPEPGTPLSGIVEALKDYALYDEETYSDLELQIHQEDWAAFGRHDLRMEADVPDTVTDAELDAWYYNVYYDDVDLWHAETAVSGRFDYEHLVELWNAR